MYFSPTPTYTHFRCNFSPRQFVLNLLSSLSSILPSYECESLFSLTLEGPCIIFCNMYTFQRDTQCCSTDCLLMLRCQLYMFRTVTFHPQELLFRYCMCRIRYVLIRPAGTTFLKGCTSWTYRIVLFLPRTIVCTYSI